MVISASATLNTRKQKIHEYNGHAVKLTQGCQAGEQLKAIREADNKLTLVFGFSRYENVGRRRAQISHTRIVVCFPELVRDGGDFVWTQKTSMVF